jgi:hypothetical protein
MKPKFRILSIILLIITFLLIASLGLPILIDLVLILIISLLTKLNLITLINLNIMLIIATFLGNFFLIKNSNEESLYYRAHEKFFINEKNNYVKNINYKTLMPHGDLIAMDVCHNFLDIVEPRNQLFITDENGFRNDRYNIYESDIIFVGDSFIAGSSNSQEHVPANIYEDLTKQKTYSITSISSPEIYEKHIEEQINKMKSTAEIYLFYFSGNDFDYKFSNKNEINDNSFTFNDTFKAKIRFGYERLERNKDKFFIEKLSKINDKNLFYKRIRPQSQRFFKKTLTKWTNLCPVKYKNIQGHKVGFYYDYDFFLNENNHKIKYITSHIIQDSNILKKINKIYYIPTKYEIYQNFFNEKKIVKVNNFEYLKREYKKFDKEVIDLTPILKKEAEHRLNENKFIYWKDDTHWNIYGIEAAMKFISKNN